MDEANHVIVEKQNHVLKLGINRPEKKNALTRAMYDTLRRGLLDAKHDPEIKSVLFYGTLDAFSAGNDLKDFDNRQAGEKSPAELFLTVIHGFEKPVVAAVSGVAVGIGVTLLMHCDLVYAAPDARFRMPFVNLGVVPEAASTLLLPMNAGYKQAAEIFMLGEFFDTSKAIDIGVVNSEIPKDQLLKYAVEIAETLAQKPSEALLLTKKLLKSALQKNVSERIVEECGYFEKLLRSEESIAARKGLKKPTQTTLHKKGLE